MQFIYFRLARAALTVEGRRLRRSRDFQVLSYSGSGSATGTLRRRRQRLRRRAISRALGSGEIPLVGRGGCLFREKARNARAGGRTRARGRGGGRSRRGVPSGTLGVPGIRIPVVLVSLDALGDGAGSPCGSASTPSRARGETENVIAETPGGERGTGW